MVSVQNLSVSYGEVEALCNVSFTVAAGECFGLLGPNGAGKTTAIGALCGLIAPQGGTVTIDGLTPHADREAFARRLGLVPQELAFYPSLTARENLRFFGRLYGLWGARLRARTDAVLAVVQLRDRVDDRVDTFSHGMKRRLSLAIGLLHEPAVLVLDEPTVGVDAQSRSALLDAFAALSRSGTTIVYTTHYMEEAQRLCHRVGIIDGGRLIAVDEPAVLVRQAGVTPTGVADLERAFLHLTGRRLRD